MAIENNTNIKNELATTKSYNSIASLIFELPLLQKQVLKGLIDIVLKDENDIDLKKLENKQLIADLSKSLDESNKTDIFNSILYMLDQTTKSVDLMNNNLQKSISYKKDIECLLDFRLSIMTEMSNNISTLKNLLISQNWNSPSTDSEKVEFEFGFINPIFLLVSKYIENNLQNIDSITCSIQKQINLIKEKIELGLTKDVYEARQSEISTNYASPYRFGGQKIRISWLIASLFFSGHLVNQDGTKVPLKDIRKAVEKMIVYIHGDNSYYINGFVSEYEGLTKEYILIENDISRGETRCTTDLFFKLMKSFAENMNPLVNELQPRLHD